MSDNDIDDRRSLTTEAEEASTPALLAQLVADDPGYRYMAVVALSRRNEPEVVAALANRLEAEPVFELREDIAKGLGALGNEASVEMLVEWIRRERVGKPSSAATALSQLGAAGYAAALAGIQDISPDVRYWTAVALARAGNALALPALDAAMNVESGKSCSGASVRLAMQKAILRLQAAQR